MKIYDFVVKNNKGADVSLSEYAGKVLLIVNTATGCGFTPQYKGLQELYEKFASDGFFVLDFPCNQFFSQAPGSDAEINEFCTLKYATTFPRFSKIEVNGDKAEPLFVYLKNEKRGKMGKAIKWNFTKFLVDKEGNVVKRFAPTTKPEKIEKYIKELL